MFSCNIDPNEKPPNITLFLALTIEGTNKSLIIVKTKKALFIEGIILSYLIIISLITIDGGL